MSAELADYAAIVLYYRYGVGVEDTLRSLLAQDPPPSHVVLVDNNSQDGVSSALSETEEFAQVAVLRLSSNLGYAGGMNAGVRSFPTRPAFLLFLTHEVILEPSCLKAMLSAARESQASVVGPSLTIKNVGAVWSHGGLVTRTGSTRHITNVKKSGAAPVAWVDGACILISRSAYEGARGFDERFFLYWEDVDICLAARAYGGVICVSNARACQSTLTPPLYYADRNQILLWRKWHRPTLVVFSVLRSIAKLLIRDVWSAKADRRGRCAARLAAICDGLRDAHRPQHGQLRENSLRSSPA